MSPPKGRGAIHGIDEKFAANPVAGTDFLAVPVYASPGRSGFGPQLSLSYDSGSGNGPFGFGWSLSLPSITRKTDKGLPKYQDVNESDVFILSGAEDLVPVFKKDQNGNWIRDAKRGLIFDEEEREGYVVRRFRPRIEELFADIERWMRKTDGDIHWQSISKDNILTVYGRDEQSRISDPADKSRIFSWLICESYDDKGNAIVYEYVAENDKGIDLSQTSECNRLRTANRYIKRIQYGNRKPLLLDTNKSSFRKPHTEQMDFSSAGWMFEVVFDYNEDHYRMPPLDNARSEVEQHRFVQASASAGGTWLSRPDPFSIHRAGFEVRTYRRCQRVLMFHCFPELGSEPCLVRSTEFHYLDLDYSKPVAVETELKHNGSTRFASFIRAVIQSGYMRDEAKPAVVLNGVKHLSYLKKSLPPLEFEYSQAAIQKEIKEIDPESLTNLPCGLDGARYQLADLDGEGLSGILTEQVEAWVYKRSLGGGRFGPLEKVRQVLDEEKRPLLVFGDGTESIYLADMSGDGLIDLVRIRNGEVCYWPNLGYGCFGAKVTMDNAPWFDASDQFDQKRIRLADIDGLGVTDIIYLGRNGVQIYFNRSGNSWSSAMTLSNFPSIDNLSSIQVVDLLGNGSACLVWSSPLLGDSHRPMRYIDLMGAQKLHLLISSRVHF